MPFYLPPDMDELKFNDSEDKTTDSERRAVRELLQSPTPKRIYKTNDHGVYGYKAPPPPSKMRRETRDEIVECAMKLMDLCMDQNRTIRCLEEELNKELPVAKSYAKYNP